MGVMGRKKKAKIHMKDLAGRNTILRVDKNISVHDLKIKYSEGMKVMYRASYNRDPLEVSEEIITKIQCIFYRTLCKLNEIDWNDILRYFKMEYPELPAFKVKKELCNFLALKMVMQNKDIAERLKKFRYPNSEACRVPTQIDISPCIAVDKMWHSMLLHPKFCVNLYKSLSVECIDHDPMNQFRSSESYRGRYSLALTLLELVLDGEIHSMWDELPEKVAMTSQWRFIYKGKQMQDGLALKAYGIQNEDSIHVLQRLAGC